MLIPIINRHIYFRSPVYFDAPPSPFERAQELAQQYHAQLAARYGEVGVIRREAPRSTVSHKPRRVTRNAKSVTQSSVTSKCCAVCGKPVSSRAKTCGTKCRSKLSRRNKKAAVLAA